MCFFKLGICLIQTRVDGFLFFSRVFEITVRLVERGLQLITTSGPGSDQSSLSGSEGATSGRGFALVLSAFCLVILSWMRKIPSLIFRPRYATIAGCQSTCDLRNSAIRLPANRYLARAVLNRFSCSSFSPCCAERYALRKISLGSSCCPTRTRVAPTKRTRASKAAAARLTRWRGAKISQLRADFRSTASEN